MPRHIVYKALEDLLRRRNMANQNTYPETFDGDTMESTQKITDRVNDVVNQAKDSAKEIGRTAAAKIDEGRIATADTLQSTASSLRGGAQNSGEAITNIGHKTASGLESAASYLRGHDFKSMVSDLEDVARRNPGPSLMVAAALGFLLGAALKNRQA
jgi:ElaB/YqjD/DUF883 family membrane-anchored ribosome-binding protein